MATISATAVFVAARPQRSPGLPRLRVAKAARLRCSCSKDLKKKASSALAMAVVKGAPLLAEASAMAVAAAPVLAPALVDERVSTDGTGLSHDLLGWILMVAFGLALSYTYYSSILKDDNDDDHPAPAASRSEHHTAIFFFRLPDLAVKALHDYHWSMKHGRILNPKLLITVGILLLLFCEQSTFHDGCHYEAS
ncbi:photosystem II reaction center W protein, chloroplastic-like [Triticum aestivum]|uniref:photosystem II reaction center W protein, chloroplastic-like n=1 Tax=Triticum aestivum TaxID=4565 RepID=UPI001D008AA9|nr:photosystem II reaction center W protein, chloroplastic-like [Triticum aestivum]